MARSSGDMGRLKTRALLGCTLLALGCREQRSGPPGERDAAGVASARAAQGGSTARIAELRAAELARNSAAIVEDDLISRDPARRRAAARALARIADARAAELLGRVLADEDPEVTAWAAFGLGRSCAGREASTIRRLSARSASLAADTGPRSKSVLDPEFAIADALARCGTALAEHGLRARLASGGEAAELAARALGKLASRQQQLEDASQVALLDAASRGADSLEYALFAFSRLPVLGDGVKARLIEVGQQAIAAGGLRQAFAVRALGSAGEGAAAPLAKLLIDRAAPAATRADAARQLGRLGAAGQKALAGALPELARPEQLEAPALSSPEFGVLSTALGALQEIHGARAVLELLAERALPEPAPLRRRVVLLRCQAARVLAGRASLAKRLLACDPDPDGRTGALAVLAVLDRGPLTGARRARWTTFCGAKDPVIAQAALELIPKHPELETAAPELGAALAAPQAGTVATAAQVLAKAPARARTAGTERPDPKLVTALSAALERARKGDHVELTAALIDAAAALELLSAKPAIESFCKSPRAALREHAEQALRRFGEKKQRCDVIQPDTTGYALAPADAGARFVLVTDAGELGLTLDPALAPATVAEFSRLVAAGFYRGIALHRVVPGFVAQFGDPGGDGFGGSGRTLPSESSPLPFRTGSVGLALAGPDSGSSQLFVTLGTYPHLDGDYPLLGSAEGSWDALAQGDVVREIRAVGAHP